MMTADAAGGGCLVLLLALLGILGIAFSEDDAKKNSAENKRIDERMKRHGRSVRD